MRERLEYLEVGDRVSELLEPSTEVEGGQTTKMAQQVRMNSCYRS